jgi:F0F1-type ATP synthase membrane subunit b/b'
MTGAGVLFVLVVLWLVVYSITKPIVDGIRKRKAEAREAKKEAERKARAEQDAWREEQERIREQNAKIRAETGLDDDIVAKRVRGGWG